MLRELLAEAGDKIHGSGYCLLLTVALILDIRAATFVLLMRCWCCKFAKLKYARQAVGLMWFESYIYDIGPVVTRTCRSEVMSHTAEGTFATSAKDRALT